MILRGLLRADCDLSEDLLEQDSKMSKCFRLLMVDQVKRLRSRESTGARRKAVRPVPAGLEGASSASLEGGISTEYRCSIAPSRPAFNSDGAAS